MTEQSNPSEKKPHELTSEEALRQLFPPEVVEEAKREAEEAAEKRSNKKDSR